MDRHRYARARRRRDDGDVLHRPRRAAPAPRFPGSGTAGSRRRTRATDPGLREIPLLRHALGVLRVAAPGHGLLRAVGPPGELLYTDRRRRTAAAARRPGHIQFL